MSTETGNKKVMAKLLQARKAISETPIKKDGKNTFSKYDYFTPSQVHKLVEDASQDTKILPMFSLVREEGGYKGVLTVADVESGESLEFTLVTAMPDIKATNEAQKLGGMATYTERYLKMSVFGIVDNNLDFDSQDNRPKAEPKQPEAKKQAPVKKEQPKADDLDNKIIAFVQSKPTLGTLRSQAAKAIANGMKEEKVKELYKQGGVNDSTLEQIFNKQ